MARFFKKAALLSLFLATLSPARAQQNIGFRAGSVTSPEVNADGSVTFRLYAPKAHKVAVLGDWEQGGGEMAEGEGGVWSYTTAPLPSELYTYRFAVDGLVGLDPANAFTKRDVGTVFSIFYVGGGYGDLYQVQDVPHGQVTQRWYRSSATGQDRRLSIYLPAAYDGKRKFPVLYLLHGSGGDETAWLELGCVPRILDNLIAQGKAEPMIVVMPNGNIGAQAAPGETIDNLAFRPVMSNEIPSSYKNGTYEASFGDIVGFIDTNYRTIRDRDHRAVAGLSMGGFHSLYISINHPDMFSYVGLFSAGLGPFFQSDSEVYQRRDEKLLALQKRGCKLFWIAIGKDDFLYRANADFRAELDSIGFRYEYLESARGHLWCNWRQYLVRFVPRLFR